MITKIIFKSGKYFLATIITMFLWNYAGLAVSAKDDLAVAAGFALYFGIAALWVWLIGSEIRSESTPIAQTGKSDDGDDHRGCGCSRHNTEKK